MNVAAERREPESRQEGDWQGLSVQREGFFLYPESNGKLLECETGVCAMYVCAHVHACIIK